MFSTENISFNMLNTGENPSVPAITKAAKLLRAIADARHPLGVSELARRTGLSKSTVYGLVTALAQEGFVRPVGEPRVYALGPQLADLGQKARVRQLVDAAQQHLDRLADATGETLLFGQLSGNRVVVLARNESGPSLKLSAPLGSTVPLLAGALAKAYAAALPSDTAFPDGVDLPRYTDRSITSPRAFRQEVETARSRGYGTERGEYLPGITAAAVCFHSAGTAYFLWSVGIDAVTSDEELAAAGTALREAADRIVSQLEDRAVEAVRSAS
jgi:DNA-binding IclR family transcriptional regulator